MYNVIFDKDVYKFFEKHKWEEIINQLNQAINILKLNPFKNNLDIKPLRWMSDNYRLRIWKYRLLYEIKNNTLIIYFYKVWSRWDIYK